RRRWRSDSNELALVCGLADEEDADTDTADVRARRGGLRGRRIRPRRYRVGRGWPRYCAVRRSPGFVAMSAHGYRRDDLSDRQARSAENTTAQLPGALSRKASI